MTILTPWKMYAEYADNTALYFYGNDEEDCMYKIAKAQEKHGECTYYTGVCDEHYEAGECIV